MGQLYDTFPAAKSACAKLALQEGILDFIKYGGSEKSQPDHKPVELEPGETGYVDVESLFYALPKHFTWMPKTFGPRKNFLRLLDALLALDVKSKMSARWSPTTVKGVSSKLCESS